MINLLHILLLNVFSLEANLVLSVHFEDAVFDVLIIFVSGGHYHLKHIQSFLIHTSLVRLVFIRLISHL